MGLISLIVILVLIVSGIIGFRIAAGILKGKVVQALEPGGDVGQERGGGFGRGSQGPRRRPATALRREESLTA